MKSADRIASLRPYFFAQLGKRIVEMRQAGVDVIRMDMGSPDLEPPKEVIQALVNAAQRADTHGYTLGTGTHSYRQAVADYYQRRFAVQLDPQSEIIDLIGR